MSDLRKKNKGFLEQLEAKIEEDLSLSILTLVTRLNVRTSNEQRSICTCIAEFLP